MDETKSLTGQKLAAFITEKFTNFLNLGDLKTIGEYSDDLVVLANKSGWQDLESIETKIEDFCFWLQDNALPIIIAKHKAGEINEEMDMEIRF